MFDLYKSLVKNSALAPEIVRVMQAAMPWMRDLRSSRDKVVHFKAKAVVFEMESVCFCLISPSNTPSVRPPLRGVFDFANTQMVGLYTFMNVDLVAAIREYCDREALALADFRGRHQVHYPGVALFKALNAVD